MDWAYVISVAFPPVDGIDGVVASVARAIDTELGRDDPDGERWNTTWDGDAWRIAVLTDTPAAMFIRLRSGVHAAANGFEYRVTYRRLTRHPETEQRIEHGPPVQLRFSASSIERRQSASPLSSLLVIQLPWPDGDLAGFDRIVDLETRIDSALSAADDESVFVDGHDAGPGELNIFIVSDAPAQTFESIRPLIEEWAPGSDVRAAYRDRDGDVFTILWPPGLATFVVS